MSRVPSTTDLKVDVEGIGRFMFSRRVMRDQYRIRGAYNELTHGNYDENGMADDLAALGFVTIQCLLVSAPDGFSIDDIDPLTEENPDEKVLKVFFALREKEASFRRRSASKVQETGAEPGAQLRDGVQAPVQSPAD